MKKLLTRCALKNIASDRARHENVPRNIHSYLVFKIFQNAFSKAGKYRLFYNDACVF